MWEPMGPAAVAIPPQTLGSGMPAQSLLQPDPLFSTGHQTGPLPAGTTANWAAQMRWAPPISHPMLPFSCCLSSQHVMSYAILHPAPP